MMENNKDDGREFTRVPIKVWVEVRTKDVVIKTHETHDMSMVGISLQHKGKVLPLGTLCDISVFLEGADPPIHVDMKGKVGRITDKDLCFEFLEVELESYEHLQNLVRYNSKDIDTVDREIDEHAGLKRKE
ncbi:MAG: PilZ domain-containing protein [Nitrospinae bacterium]|nr:PilZ domain-containing protein [Nitrospinota bacterium]MBL7019142.1 PilZ domain-containing protein [Nitrospinaceae bacterium]